jgi:hypothetical protein
MKLHLACLGAAAALGLSATAAPAQYYPPPQGPYPYYQPYQYLRVAPDMCGGYFYCMNQCGTWYGPSYCVYPPFAPFNGLLPGKAPPPGMPPFPTPYQFACQQGNGGPGNVALPVNPWTRSPRDYFMWNEAQQERHTRETRPPFVP